MSKRIQHLVVSALSGIVIPVFCFALPTFGSMPLVDPVAQAPSAACASAATETSLSGLNNKADPIFYSYPTDAIQTSAPQYCAFSTPVGAPAEDYVPASGTMY